MIHAPRRRASSLAVLLLALLPGLTGAGGSYATYESASGFDDVLDALKLAIEERGMYINNVMHMGEMLERTGADLGDRRQIYGKAESVEFCSAVLSREMTLEDPARIVYCPFIVSVYTLPDQEGTTYLAHREIAQEEIESSPTMAKVATMLKEVASAAANW